MFICTLFLVHCQREIKMFNSNELQLFDKVVSTPEEYLFSLNRSNFALSFFKLVSTQTPRKKEQQITIHCYKVLYIFRNLFGFCCHFFLKSLESFGFSKLLFYIFTTNPLEVQFLKSSLGIYSMKYGKQIGLLDM